MGDTAGLGKGGMAAQAAGAGSARGSGDTVCGFRINYSNLTIEVTAEGDWAKGLGWLKQLNSRSKNWKGIGDALQEVSERSAAALRSYIAYGTFSPSSGTLRKRRMGKLKGERWDPISVYSGTRGWHRSGALANAISWQRRTKRLYSVGVLDGRFGEFAGRGYIQLADLAAQLESGWTINVTVTARMVAYLHILFRGGGPVPRHHAADVDMNRILVTNVKGRPVFSRTWGHTIEPKAFDWFETAWLRSMQLTEWK